MVLRVLYVNKWGILLRVLVVNKWGMVLRVLVVNKWGKVLRVLVLLVLLITGVLESCWSGVNQRTLASQPKCHPV